MKWKSPFLPLMLIMLSLLPFITGCAIKPFQSRSNEKRALSEQLKTEKSQRQALQSELKKLKTHLKTFKADLEALKTKAIKQSKQLKEQFPSSEETRVFTKEMGDRVKKTFNKTLAPIKEGYEDTLEKSNQEMTAFQKQLREKQKKLSKLKKEVTNKIEALLSLEKEIESGD